MKATPCTAHDLAAIELHLLRLKDHAIRRIVGNRENLPAVLESIHSASVQVKQLVPLSESDCPGDWRHLADCNCEPIV